MASRAEHKEEVVHSPTSNLAMLLLSSCVQCSSSSDDLEMSGLKYSMSKTDATSELRDTDRDED